MHLHHISSRLNLYAKEQKEKHALFHQFSEWELDNPCVTITRTLLFHLRSGSFTHLKIDFSPFFVVLVLKGERKGDFTSVSPPNLDWLGWRRKEIKECLHGRHSNAFFPSERQWGSKSHSNQAQLCKKDGISFRVCIFFSLICTLQFEINCSCNSFNKW